MYHPSTTHVTPEYAPEGIALFPSELDCYQNWCQPPDDLGSSACFINAPLEFDTDFPPHLELGFSAEPACRNAAFRDNSFDVLETQQTFEEYHDSTLYASSQPALSTACLAPYDFNVDVNSAVGVYGEDQSEVLEPLSSGWGVTQMYSVWDSSSFYSHSPTTTCASEITTTSSLPPSIRLSLSSPSLQAEPVESCSNGAAKSEPKLRLLPSKKHTRTANGDTSHQFRCANCDRSFTLLKDLERHKRSVHDQQRLPCNFPGCKRGGFRRKDALLHHMRRHHRIRFGPETGTSSAAGDTEAYECIRPRSTVDGLTNMSISDKVNNIDGVCSLNPDSAKQSVLNKQTSSPSCPVTACGKIFANQHDLIRHRRTIHKGQGFGEVYRCALCSTPDKIWSRLDNFKRHLSQQHNLVHVEETVRKSTVFKNDAGGSVSFAVTTPQTFGQMSERP